MKPIPDRKRIVRIYVFISIQIGIMSYLRYLCLFTYSGVQHILCCVFCFRCLLYPMLLVVLDCQFLVASSVLSRTFI